MRGSVGGASFGTVRRSHEERRASGLKLLRVWVPDPLSPGFHAEAERQATLLRSAPEDEEALDFIDAVTDPGHA